MAQGDPILLVADHPDDVLLVQRAFRRAQSNVAPRVASDGESVIASSSPGNLASRS